MKIILKIFFIFLYIFAFSLKAEVQKKITIVGNENIDNEIIFSIIDGKIKDYSKDNLNEIIKVLYNTGNFKKIEIEDKADEIILKIEENPSINKIEFSGNKRFKDDDLLEIFSKEKYFQTYNELLINNFIFDLKNLYASFGYNIVNIEYESNQPDENINLVNVNFNIEEGNISKINRIYFIDNIEFSNSKLRTIIQSKQRNYLRLTRATNFKKFQIEEDRKKIIEFYKIAGFKDIRVEVKNEFIKNKNRLNVYFYLDEGEQYYFRDFDFNLNELIINKEIADKIIANEVEDLSKILKKKNYYNPEIYDESKKRLSESLYSNGEFFFEIDVLEKKDGNNIDLMFEISSVEPNYINTINIYGNTRTKEKVIRREIPFVEGDPYNTESLRVAEKNLRRLNFFKKIEIEDVDINNQKDININVDEKSTGEFNLGLSLDSYEGATFITGLKEKNIFGDGRELNLSIDTSSRNTIYSFGIVEPYIFNKKIDFIYDLSYAFKDRSENKSYDLEEFRTDVGFRYELSSKITHSIVLEYILKDYEITGTSPSTSISKLAGSNADILIDNKINYFDLDSFIRPSNGSSFNYSNILSPSTNDDNGYMKNVISYTKYIPYKKRNIFSFKTKVGNIFSLQNKELPVDDKFSLGGRWLRGFDRYGVGPRESRSSYIGGQNMFVAKFDFDRPISGNYDNPIDLNLFTDIGTVYDNKNSPTHSDESIRASYGFGLKFYSPIGPIGVSWGFPILKEDYDIQRMFSFNIGIIN